MKRSRLVSLALLCLLTGLALGAPASAKARRPRLQPPRLPFKSAPTQQSICLGFWGICMDTNASDLYCLRVYYECMSPAEE